MSGPEMHESGDSDAVKARETDTNQQISKIHYFYKIHYFAGRPDCPEIPDAEHNM